MLLRTKIGALRGATTLIATLGVLASAGCIDRPVEALPPVTQSGIQLQVVNQGVDTVDLLMMIDNSNSMRDNQSEIMVQLGTMISTLVNPPCTSPTNETPHVCNASDPTDTPQYPPVKSMNVGVVDSDLGTPGQDVPGCDNSTFGDDGQLNPIRNGMAESQHEPWVSAPASFGRPASCNTPDQYPAFINFDSAMAAAMGAAYTSQFVTDFQCNAGLYVNGCGLESQLEAVWRALIWHDPSDRVGNTDPNAGFMRSDALLAIVELTDEEDTSVRNCMYAHGAPCVTDMSDPNPLHQDALDFYNAASTNWSNANLNMRCYMYQPCGAQDPAWPLERYIDPNDPTAGFPGLKPNQPQYVLFAAITGVPLNGWQNPGGTADWDKLLGSPGPGGANDYCNRNANPSQWGGATSLALNDPTSSLSPEGPTSMWQANQDPGCPERTVPSCRREGSTYPGVGMDCTTDLQYFAWPARRIVEVARRFDQANFCPLGQCNNGLVASICASDYSSAMAEIVAKIQSNLTGKCLPRTLQQTPDVSGNLTVQCLIVEEFPVGGVLPDMCDASHGQSDPTNMSGTPTAQHVTINGTSFRVCDIAQVPVSPPGSATPGQPADPTLHGWFYDTSGSGMSCPQAITFTSGDAPGSGSITNLECIQQITGVADASTTGG